MERFVADLRSGSSCIAISHEPPRAGRRENLIAHETVELRQIVGAARAGGDSAFSELYRWFFRMVHAVLLSRVPPADVGDLTQEVFLQAWRQLRSLRDPLAFGGWLRRIALHQSANHIRRGHHTEELDSRAASSPALSPNDEEAWLLLAEIRRLPEAYRETLVLRFVEGLTGPEIADLTGLTPGSSQIGVVSPP